MKVIPPNFGYVEEAIFRCGAPEPRHYGFLASLGLRACVLLTDTHDDAFVHWLQETGVMIFCPLSSEAQTRGTVRSSGGGAVDGVGFPPSRSSGGMQAGTGGASTTNNNNLNVRDEVREETALPNGTLGETFGNGGARFGSSAAAAAAAGEGPSSSGFHDGADGAEGGYDGSGNFNGEETAGGAGGRGMSWGGTAGANNGTNASTSNAARFLRANVAERQVNTKFSPVLVQEPVYFPGGGEASARGGPAVSFTSAPTYEGRLHGLMTLSEAVVVSILHIVLDPQYYPLLITCSKGRYRSGIICGCLRKLQRWNLVSILEEYRRFAANKSRADNEEFIELFDEELVNLELSGGRRPSILYNV